MKTLRNLVLALLIGAAPASAANIVLNSSFEDGNANWSATSWVFFSNTSYARTGTSVAATGCIGPASLTTCSVEQALATTAGEAYDLSFWVAESGGPISGLRIEWDGVEVFNVANPANSTCPFVGGVLSCNWVQFGVDNLIASGASTVLSFFGQQNPAGIYLEDISVEQVEGGPAPVPEPASMLLLGSGLVAVAAGVRRRQRQQS